MADLLLHHVAVVTRDAAASTAFYTELFGLQPIPRPPFSFDGAWLAAGPSLQVHLIEYDPGTYRQSGVDSMDSHFALRTADFEGFVSRALALGFREDLPEGDLKRIVIKRNSIVGFHQAYVIDPDRNVIEINSAA